MSHFNLAVFTLDENPNLDEIMDPFFRGKSCGTLYRHDKKRID